MATDTIHIVDADDLSQARQLDAAIAAAQEVLARHQARRAQIQGMLASQVATDADASVETARKAAAKAHGEFEMASGGLTAAEKDAETYAKNDLSQAQDGLDLATKSLGDELARLLRDATTSAALTATIDGLALRQRYQLALQHDPPLWDMATIPLRAHKADQLLDPQIALPALEGDDDLPAFLGALARHDQRVDAVADLVAAEALHHVVNGNTARAGAALDVAATGAVPDDLDIISTPRRGRDTTHRVLLLTDPASAPAWTSPRPCLAALVDPGTTAWVSHVLPDPSRVHFTVGARHADSTTEDLALTADALGLDPMAWLRVAADPGELLARVARVASDTWQLPSGQKRAAGALRLSDPPPDPTRLTLTDLLTAAATTTRALRTARALSAADLLPPDTAAPSLAAGTVTAALAAANAAATHVEKALKALTAITVDTPAEKLMDALLDAAALGIAEAAPDLRDPFPTPATLRDLAAAAAIRLTPRTLLQPLAPADTPELTLTAVRERLTALTGATIPLLVTVPVPLDPATRSDLDQTPREGAGPAEVRDWLAAHARVRPALSAIQDCIELAEALGCTAALDARGSQLPSDDGPWVGTQAEPTPGTTGLVVLRDLPDKTPAQVSGLAVDAWVQTVPDATLDTAVAFHFDEPDALPPQAILVAAAPDTAPDRAPSTWDLDSLLDIVTSTIALAADRAVAADRIPGAQITLADPHPGP